MRTAILLMVGAVCLGGCAGSSGNTTAMNSTGYNAQGVSEVNADSVNATSFAPTAAAAAHSSAASVAADKLTSVATPGNAAYKIGPADVLDISVFKVPDLAKTVQVADDGTINYPLIGEVAVAGKTAHDLERDLAQRLGVKYLRSPQVSVLVKEFNSQRVTVSGSVKTAGVYGIKGNTTLLQVLAMAGDLDNTVASGDVVVFRTTDGQRTAARFDIDALKAGKADDPQMQPGDVVVVDTSATKVALGNVLKMLPIATTAAVFSGL
jgi:polysaccharide export outer membrane protein